MTEKRFQVAVYDDGFQSIYDMENDEYLTEMDLSKIEELLNELHNENQQLKLSNRLLLEEMKEIRDKLTVYLEIRKGDYND